MRFFVRFAMICLPLLGCFPQAGAVEAPITAPGTESAAAAPNVAITNITQNAMQVRWEPITGATRYELSYGTDAQGTNRGTLFVTVASYALTNLLSNTTYNIKVRAIAAGRAGAWSTLQSVSTQIPVMNDLTADDIRDTTVHLTWSDIYGDLPDTAYDLSYGTDPDATSDGSISSLKNFATLKSLSPETTYFIKLRVRNPHATGPWSQPISVTTLAFSSNNTPAEITIQPIEAGGLKLTWKPLANADGYDLAYGTDAVAENMGIVPLSTAMFTLQVAPNTRYYFKVRAVLNGNSTAWGPIKNFLTFPSVPRGLMVSRQSANEAVVSWKSLSGGNISRFYHLSWGTDSQGTNQGVTVTTNTEYVLEGLKSDQRYYLRVRTVNTTGPSGWSEVFAFKTLAAGVTRLKLLDTKHTTAKIDWPEVTHAVTYELTYSPSPANELERGRVMELAHPPAELKDLKPNQTYQAKLRAIFQNHQPGAWSNDLAFTTFPVPPAPEDMTITHIGGTYVKLTWTPLEGISTYEVVVTPDEFSDQGSSQIVNRPMAQVSALDENTQYFVKVRSLNLGGPGLWSPAKPLATLPDLTPKNLSISHIAPTECLVTWNRLNGSAATTYELRFAPPGEVWRSIANYPAQTLGLEKLQPNALYRLQIRAKNPTGLGPWSEEITFHTPPLPPQTAPPGLTAQELTDISAKVVWKPMEAVDGYRLSMGTDTDASNRGQETLAQTEKAFAGLVPETTYFVKVMAYNTTGDGPWSTIVMFSTPPSPPMTAPESVEIMDVLPTGFTVVWKPATDAGSYEVGFGTSPKVETAEIKAAATFTYEFRRLDPAKRYYVRVRKVNRGGGGPWSQVQSVMTLAQ